MQGLDLLEKELEVVELSNKCCSGFGKFGVDLSNRDAH